MLPRRRLSTSYILRTRSVSTLGDAAARWSTWLVEEWWTWQTRRCVPSLLMIYARIYEYEAGSRLRVPTAPGNH